MIVSLLLGISSVTRVSAAATAPSLGYKAGECRAAANDHYGWSLDADVERDAKTITSTSAAGP